LIHTNFSIGRLQLAEYVRKWPTHAELSVVGYMCGHESKSGTGARYGKRKVPVLAKEIALFPRFKVPALNRPPAPLKRTRRSPQQIAADKDDRAARRTAA